MASYHTVQQGEHLSRIAEKYGFHNYLTIWDRPENKDLKEKRVNPNVLAPGDRLFIPDKQTKREHRPTGSKHRFKITEAKLMLRLAVRNLDSKPVANTPCQLIVEGTTFQLTTDGNGKIEQLIPATAETGNLIIGDLQVPIKIGHLDPVDQLAGYRARLNNLGYDAGDADDVNDPQLRSAIEEFQCDHDLSVNGDCDGATQSKLKEIHGC